MKNNYIEDGNTHFKKAKEPVGGICTLLPCVVAVFVLKGGLTHPQIRAAASNLLLCKVFSVWISLSTEVDRLHVRKSGLLVMWLCPRTLTANRASGVAFSFSCRLQR